MPGQNPRQGWESVDLSNGVKLAFTRSSSNLPITKIRLTETEVCMRKEEFGVTKGRDPYPLYESDECTYSLSGKHNDPRYEVIGAIREDILFHENGLDDDLKALPLYDLSEG